MDSLPRTSGIYKITCTPNGKIYIGSAIDLHKRHRDHWSSLRSGKHKNPYLLKAWNKYGESAFTFAIIELVLSSFILEREQFWLDKLRSYDPQRGFNIYHSARSPLGSRHSDEAKTKMSISRKGKPGTPRSAEHKAAISAKNLGSKRTPEQRQRMSELVRARTPLSNDAKMAISAKLSAAAKGKKKSPESIAASAAKRRGLKRTPEYIESMRLRVSKTYTVIDPDGNKYDITNLNAFCRAHNLTTSGMCAVANGRAPSHKRWKCCLKDRE